jgi:uncharacterized protein with HEPN domain
MQASNRDAASLWDMVQAIHRIQEFTADLLFEDYQASMLIQSAVERQLEILGEAAARISLDFRQAHSEVDWRRIVGLRNIIIHRYDEIQQDVLWKVITSELTNLLAQLEPLLPPLPHEER